LSTPGELFTGARQGARLWHIRKGLYTAVAGNRPSGTTALLEDIAVPVEGLLATCEALVDLFSTPGAQPCRLDRLTTIAGARWYRGSVARYEPFRVEDVEPAADARRLGLWLASSMPTT